MHVVFVRVKVKAERLDDFIEATLANARASNLEPGVARFDFLRSSDDPTRFVLVEAYKDADAPVAHRASAHYLAWKAAVEPMMDGPRTRETFAGIYVPEHTA